MKVNANNSPALPYLVERHPQHEEMAVVTLYENALETDEIGVYSYDAYQVTVPWRDDLTMKVAENTQDWLAAAKSMDAVQAVQDASDAVIAQNEAAIDELLLLIGGDV